ncbi:MAG: class I SAM-dependent methyltransferase [Nevskia sp.]|nr:class I SAM-dependent methyltransferase [Nevskia sp.]
MTPASNSPGTTVERFRPPADDGVLIRLAESGRIPDAILRMAIRHLCRQRLIEEHARDPARHQQALRARLAQWRSGPIALATEAANAQHYEVPAEFFRLVLGPHLKYSCALWQDVRTLAQAEEAMLALTCERAGLADGMRVLDLGCGWGSFALYAAARFPKARITAVSNSASQRAWILRAAQARGLDNVEVLTADVNAFQPSQRYDRIVSVEMLEHVRNHEALFCRLRRWLTDDGALFVHVFCHRELAYPFESQGRGDWMARHFFTGGIMPSFDLFLHYARDLRVAECWWLSGEHYAKTAAAWRENLERNRAAVQALFAQTYGRAEAALRYGRWRLFFMAVEEFFGYDRGRQWGVGHYLLVP